MNKFIIIALAVIMLLLAACGKGEAETSETAVTPEKVTQHFSWIVDPETQTEEYVGIIDNLFIAEVIKKEGTFMNKEEVPYQKFKIKILENIKGKLATDKEVTLFVRGGITPDGKYEYESIARIFSPGNKYLLTGGIAGSENEVWDEGSLVAELAYELPEDYKSSEIYAKWMKAYENELPWEAWNSVEGKD